jgi:hypothetical protein
LSEAQSRDRMTALRYDVETRRTCDERAIAGILDRSTGTINSDRNANISGDSYTRDKSLFM